MRRIFPPLNATTRTGYALGLLIFIRAFFNGALPLMDKTEARYGEIARLMAKQATGWCFKLTMGYLFGQNPLYLRGHRLFPSASLAPMNFLYDSPTYSLV